MNKKMNVVASLLCVAVCLFGGSMLYAAENARDGFSFKAGVDLPGKLDVPVGGGDTTADIGFGFSGAAEYAFGVNRTYSFGAGIAGQYPHSVDDKGMDGSVSFADGYGLMNAVLPFTMDAVSIYTSLQLGWSIPFVDSSFKDSIGTDVDTGGHVYWGAALGAVVFENYLVELNYKAHHGEVDFDGDTKEFEHRHFGVAIGYQF